LTRSWSRWRSFKDLFFEIAAEVAGQYKKPLMITEFGTTSTGGDKVRWVNEALRDVKQIPSIRALIFFNMDKETDWKIAPGSAAGRVLRDGLTDSYFRDSWTEE